MKKRGARINNVVAKNSHKFNRAATHRDRKRAAKRGMRKHKGRFQDGTD